MLAIIRPDLYEYHALPMTDELFWRRIENLRRAALTAESFEFRLLYYNQMNAPFPRREFILYLSKLHCRGPSCIDQLHC
jgi:hypothetical protein